MFAHPNQRSRPTRSEIKSAYQLLPARFGSGVQIVEGLPPVIRAQRLDCEFDLARFSDMMLNFAAATEQRSQSPLRVGR
jgi:hypothetical protein